MNGLDREETLAAAVTHPSMLEYLPLEDALKALTFRYMPLTWKFSMGHFHRIPSSNSTATSPWTNCGKSWRRAMRRWGLRRLWRRLLNTLFFTIKATSAVPLRRHHLSRTHETHQTRMPRQNRRYRTHTQTGDPPDSDQSRIPPQPNREATARLPENPRAHSHGFFQRCPVAADC
jgi:hypothetical protein